MDPSAWFPSGNLLSGLCCGTGFPFALCVRRVNLGTTAQISDGFYSQLGRAGDFGGVFHETIRSRCNPRVRLKSGRRLKICGAERRLAGSVAFCLLPSEHAPIPCLNTARAKRLVPGEIPPIPLYRLRSMLISEDRLAACGRKALKSCTIQGIHRMERVLSCIYS